MIHLPELGWLGEHHDCLSIQGGIGEEKTNLLIKAKKSLNVEKSLCPTLAVKQKQKGRIESPSARIRSTKFMEKGGRKARKRSVS
jgi:hypothetical protein